MYLIGVTMYSTFAKYIFIDILIFIIYFKLIPTRISRLYIKAIPCILSLAGISAFYVLKLPALSVIFSFFLFYILATVFFYRVPYRNFFLALISFCIGNAVFLLAALLYAMLLAPVFPSASLPSDFISMPVSFSLALCLILVPFRFPKFRKGLQRIQGIQLVKLGIFAGIPTILFLTIPHIYESPGNSFKVVPIYIATIYFLFFFFWNQQIRLHYLSRLRNLELESLRQEIKEKDSRIETLTKSNEDLARTIHKDNKLIPAMLCAVTDYLEGSENTTMDQQISHGKMLAEHLKTLGQERAGLLTEFQHTEFDLPQTHHATVDAMLSYMAKRALGEQADYQVIIQPSFSSIIGTEISEEDLTHLLSDLIDNALIAERGAANKSILIHLGILYDTPIVEISDTGADFAPEIYEDLGLAKHSTHLDTGGSGIGLMDIWKIRKKYAASLHIREYAPNDGPFSKKISLVFDHKNHFLIQSFRTETLIRKQIRGDLYIIPPDRSLS